MAICELAVIPHSEQSRLAYRVRRVAAALIENPSGQKQGDQPIAVERHRCSRTGHSYRAQNSSQGQVEAAGAVDHIVSSGVDWWVAPRTLDDLACSCAIGVHPCTVEDDSCCCRMVRYTGNCFRARSREPLGAENRCEASARVTGFLDPCEGCCRGWRRSMTYWSCDCC